MCRTVGALTLRSTRFGSRLRDHGVYTQAGRNVRPFRQGAGQAAEPQRVATQTIRIAVEAVLWRHRRKVRGTAIEIGIGDDQRRSARRTRVDGKTEQIRPVVR